MAKHNSYRDAEDIIKDLEAMPDRRKFKAYHRPTLKDPGSLEEILEEVNKL